MEADVVVDSKIVEADCVVYAILMRSWSYVMEAGSSGG